MYLKDNLRGSSSALLLSYPTPPPFLFFLLHYLLTSYSLFSSSSHPYPFYSNSSSPTLSFHASSYSNFFLFSPLPLFISFSSSSYTAGSLKESKCAYVQVGGCNLQMMFLQILMSCLTYSFTRARLIDRLWENRSKMKKSQILAHDWTIFVLSQVTKL